MKFERTSPPTALALPALLTLALTLISAPLAWSANPPPTPPAPRPPDTPVAALEPIRSRPPRPPAPPAVDPSNGLPLPSAQPWMDPAWPDPDKILPEVTYDALPLDEIGRHLQKEFRNAFDVIIPGAWREKSQIGAKAPAKASDLIEPKGFEEEAKPRPTR